MALAAAAHLAMGPGVSVLDDAPTYEVGDSFMYILNNDYDRTVFYDHQLEVVVLHTFTPFSCSPVMRVLYRTKFGNRTAILKTYDRRAGWASRRIPSRRAQLVPHHPDLDDAYASLVASGAAPQLWTRFDEEDYRPRKPASTVECYFQWLREHEFHSEVRAYQQMRHLQGQFVPQLLATMSWRPECPNSEYLMIRAILVEEVPNAMTVRDLFTNPNIYISNPLRDAISNHCLYVEGLVRGAGVIDPDRHKGNALVVMHDWAQGFFSIVLIDFGFSKIGFHDEEGEEEDDENDEDGDEDVDEDGDGDEDKDEDHVPESHNRAANPNGQITKIKLNFVRGAKNKQIEPAPPVAPQQQLAPEIQYAYTGEEEEPEENTYLPEYVACVSCGFVKHRLAFKRSRYPRVPLVYVYMLLQTCNECASRQENQMFPGQGALAEPLQQQCGVCEPRRLAGEHR